MSDEAENDALNSLEMIDGASYGSGEAVTIDGRRFVRCEFLGCTVMYGGGLFALVDCVFVNAKPLFGGSAAWTLGLLRYMDISDISGVVTIHPTVH